MLAEKLEGTLISYSSLGVGGRRTEWLNSDERLLQSNAIL